MKTIHKTCNLCEAMCGLLIEVEGDGQARRVKKIMPDPDDPLSHGAICPKAIGLKQIQEDPDRQKLPLRKTQDGSFETISWEAAFSEVADRLASIQESHGNNAVGSYLGNPGAHQFGTIMYLATLYAALDTENKYSASSLDQNPKHASSLLLYGNFLSIPVPDVDHTDFLLILGANPLVSNGSLMTAPGFKRRLAALHERGGHCVVVDPRRSETAEAADEHWFIPPGKDPLLLCAMIHTIFEEDLADTGHLQAYVDHLDELRESVVGFSAEAVAGELAVDPDDLRNLARRFAAAPSAACYGRIGTCTSPYGTLNSWLIDVLNLLTGNLDRPGGILFPSPAADLAAIAEWRKSPGTFDTGRTRVRGARSFNSERPTACLAEEILEPGEGQIRGMLTIAGNPCLSAPNGAALCRAFESLEFYVAIDFYINETTRHADIILPPTWSLEHDNYEVLFHGFAVHNTSKYSPVVIEPGPDQRDEWQILSQLARRIAAIKQGNPLLRTLLRAAQPLVPGPRRVLDWVLRSGAYGDGFRPWSTKRNLRLADLEANPSGIDLGPLVPRLRELLDNSERRIDLAPEPIQSELRRLATESSGTKPLDGSLLLIGRRDIRTNNSWFHNIPLSTKGRDRCTLQIHSGDARELKLEEGDNARVHNRVGSLDARVEICDNLMQGVVSLPHGWGHRGAGMAMRVASEHSGVNCNELTDDGILEPLVGNAIFNGVPVWIEKSMS